MMAASPQAQSKWAHKSWTETSKIVSQNKPFLRHLYSNGKLATTSSKYWYTWAANLYLLGILKMFEKCNGILITTTNLKTTLMCPSPSAVWFVSKTPSLFLTLYWPKEAMPHYRRSGRQSYLPRQSAGHTKTTALTTTQKPLLPPPRHTEEYSKGKASKRLGNKDGNPAPHRLPGSSEGAELLRKHCPFLHGNKIPKLPAYERGHNISLTQLFWSCRLYVPD